MTESGFSGKMNQDVLDRVNRQIAYAKQHSPFYRSLPKEPLATPEDFRNLPFTTDRDLRERGQEMLCCSPKQIRRMVTLASSGTTDTPKRLAFTDKDLEKTVAFFTWGMNRLCSSEEKVAIFMPGSQPDGLCDLLSRGIAAFGGVPVVYGSISRYDHGVEFLRREQPAVLVGIPGQMRRLALIAPWLRPRSVLLSADYCAPALKDTISRLWHCQVYEHFGMTESGLGCAVEGPEREGMACREDIYLEIDQGELILTTLEREGMPLIRYRTGDMARMLPNGNLERILGRKTALDKAISQNALENILFSLDTILDFRARMEKEILQIEVLGRYEDAERALRQAFPGVEVQITQLEETKLFYSGKRTLEWA